MFSWSVKKKDQYVLSEKKSYLVLLCFPAKFGQTCLNKQYRPSSERSTTQHQIRRQRTQRLIGVFNLPFIDISCSKIDIHIYDTVEPRYRELAYFELPLISK